MPKTIRQSVTFKATPHAVYEALMDSRKHARFTGDAASISRKVGGTRLAFTHSGVPDEHYESIKQGWIDNYWTPMKNMLEK